MIAKYISVILGSMFKFLVGPVTGFSMGLLFLESFALAIIGMMLSVLLFSSLGEFIRRRILNKFEFYRNRRVFTKRNRRLVRIWRRFGIAGIAFITPLILTPIVGTLVAVAFGVRRRQLYWYMFVSATFWSFICVGLLYLLGDKLLAMF